MKRARNIIALLLALVVFSGSVWAENPVETLLLTKSEFQQQAVDNSTILANLKVQRDDVMNTADAVESAASGLGMLYGQLGTYQGLYTLYQSVTAVDENGVPTDPNEMTEEQYAAYMALRRQFSRLGIGNPYNISGEKMYDTFLYTIDVLPATMDAAVDNMILAVDATEAGLKDGAGQLFDAVLFMESILALQEQGTDLSESTYNGTARKLELGLASEFETAAAEADFRISELDRDNMSRNIENMKMNMNVMIGRDVDAPLILDGVIEELSIEDTVSPLVEDALKNRSEILMIQNDMRAKNRELNTMEGYIATDSIRYRTAKNEYKNLLLKWEETKTDIKKDIYEAYRNMLLMKDGLIIADKELDMSMEQYRQMEVNYSLGFVTQDTLDAVGMGLIQAKNASVEAKRDYYNAIVKLVQAAGVGPGYANGGAGL